MKLRKQDNAAPAEESIASGGAVIADRFKLDGDPRAAKSGEEEVGKKSTMIALVCSLAALAMLGALAAMMYVNWEAIKNV